MRAADAFIARQEISATFKQHICDMQFNAVAVALKKVELLYLYPMQGCQSVGQNAAKNW